MKNILFTLLFLIVSIINAYAQETALTNYTIKGILIDSLTHDGEPYATIKIVKKELPDKAGKMAVTDNKGRFQEKIQATEGEYTLYITSIGRQTVIHNFTLKSAVPNVDLGTFYSVEASNELGTVEIIAQKPLVKVDIDKIEYNIQDDPDSQSNTIIEMLRKVPLVTVDGEDNIKVNGSSSFKIHVNGRPNSMMSNNPKEVLQSMPANSIKSIEVITNPGAKYDAEGIGGILNIVTIGGGFEGYTATFNGNVQNTSAGTGAYATIKKEKLTLTANYSYRQNWRPKSYNDVMRNNLDDQGNTVSQTVNNSISKNKGNFQYGTLEGSYEIDTLQLITTAVSLYGGKNRTNSNGESWMNDIRENDINEIVYDYRYHTIGRNKGNWYSIQGNIDYQRMSSKNKERFFTFSYKISTRPQSNDGSTSYQYNSDEMSSDWENILQLNNQKVEGNQKTIEQTLQADYTTPIGKINTLEGGLKYILRNNTSENYQYQQGENGNYQYDANRSSHYKHLNDILSAYLSYSIKINNFSGKAGLRFEHTIQNIKYIVGKGEDFKTNYNDLVPSFTLGYKLTEMSNLRFGYNMRIMRPGIWYLNPYVNDSNPTNISKGNPTLDSEKSNTFNLSYSNFTQKFNINLSLSYSFNNNGIESFSKLINEGDAVPQLGITHADHQFLFTTYENIGKSKSVGLNSYVNWNASPKTRIYLNASVEYVDLRSPSQNLHKTGWNGWFYGGVQHTFPLDIRASINFFTSTPYVTLQGKGMSWYDYGFNLSRSFLKEKRLTINLFASSFAPKYAKSKSHTDGNGFQQITNYKQQRARFGMSISYRIGELKASVQKTKRSINNDDVKGGSGGGGGGE